MPKVDKVLTLELSVERFLDACSPLELKEVELLIASPRYQHKIHPPSGNLILAKDRYDSPENQNRDKAIIGYGYSRLRDAKGKSDDRKTETNV